MALRYLWCTTQEFDLRRADLSLFICFGRLSRPIACPPTFKSRLSSLLFPGEKEKSKINSEELQIKKAKKKKKKKHKEGEKHKQVKMYHRSCQTVCAGLLLLPPSSPHPASSSTSPFKSPLPVSPQCINKNLLPSSFPLVSKSVLSCLHPYPAKHQPQYPYPGTRGLEFGPYIHIEKQPNGGALVAHAYASQLSSLSEAQRERFAREFVTLSFSEDSSQVRPALLPMG